MSKMRAFRRTLGAWRRVDKRELFFCANYFPRIIGAGLCHGIVTIPLRDCHTAASMCPCLGGRHAGGKSRVFGLKTQAEAGLSIDEKNHSIWCSNPYCGLDRLLFKKRDSAAFEYAY